MPSSTNRIDPLLIEMQVDMLLDEPLSIRVQHLQLILHQARLHVKAELPLAMKETLPTERKTRFASLKDEISDMEKQVDLLVKELDLWKHLASVATTSIQEFIG